MAVREQATKPTTRREEKPPTDHEVAQADKPRIGHARTTAADAGAEIEKIDGVLAEEAAHEQVVDDLLDEIDEVLETDAEDFVRSYVQKGGE